MWVVCPQRVRILLGGRIEDIFLALVGVFCKGGYLAVLHVQLERLVIGGLGRVSRHVGVQGNLEVECDLAICEVNGISCVYIDFDFGGGNL